MGPENFLDAQSRARAKRETTGEKIPNVEAGDIAVDPKLFDYIFKLQGKIEKGGAMDYHLYAREMWKDLVGSVPEEASDGFAYFEHAMIERLNGIDMQKHVYPEVRENLPTLLEQYGDSVKNVAIWSTGDVEATGYQVTKIARSRVIPEFYKALLEKKETREEAKEMMREKTSYIVDDNKLERFGSYMLELVRKYPGEKIKAVIVEDSVKNFERAREAVRTYCGEDASNVEVLPIWALYSREGQSARAKAEREGRQDEFNREKESLNGIESFKDLLDKPRFEKIFDGAYVFVDFDGVIGNNVTMREDQARAIAGSLVEGVSKERNIDRDAALEYVLRKFSEQKTT